MQRPTSAEERVALGMLVHVIISDDSSEFTKSHARVLLDYMVAMEASEKHFRTAEKELSDAYLRIRELLKGYGSYNTPTAPSSEVVWETTESALKKALHDAYKFASR